MKPHDREPGIFAPPRPDFQTGGFTPLSRRRSHPDRGYLKVSFFGPFYGSYLIFELDREDYQYAVISGPNKSYSQPSHRRGDLNQKPAISSKAGGNTQMVR
jgi:hypothetical protein